MKKTVKTKKSKKQKTSKEVKWLLQQFSRRDVYCDLLFEELHYKYPLEGNPWDIDNTLEHEERLSKHYDEAIKLVAQWVKEGRKRLH